MRNIIRHIPNTITLFNLFFGILSIKAALIGQLEQASWFIFYAAVLDFMDGFAARLLKAYSEIGKQLDSLADVVSFGVAPSFILFQLLGKTGTMDESSGFLGALHAVFVYFPFLIALFSALRLAKFNIDTRQSDSFLGLPTPASAMFVAAIPLQAEVFGYDSTGLFSGYYVLLGVSVFLSVLMVTEIPLFSMKFKHFGLEGNRIRYGFLFIALILFNLFRMNSVPLILALYVGISVLITIFARPNKGELKK